VHKFLIFTDLSLTTQTVRWCKFFQSLDSSSL